MEKAGNPGEDFLLGGGDKLHDDTSSYYALKNTFAKPLSESISSTPAVS